MTSGPSMAPVLPTRRRTLSPDQNRLQHRQPSQRASPFCVQTTSQLPQRLGTSGTTLRPGPEEAREIGLRAAPGDIRQQTCPQPWGMEHASPAQGQARDCLGAAR